MSDLTDAINIVNAPPERFSRFAKAVAICAVTPMSLPDALRVVDAVMKKEEAKEEVVVTKTVAAEAVLDSVIDLYMKTVVELGRKVEDAERQRHELVEMLYGIGSALKINPSLIYQNEYDSILRELKADPSREKASVSRCGCGKPLSRTPCTGCGL